LGCYGWQTRRAFCIKEKTAMSATIYKRKSIRLRGYDYKQPGSYFVTICAQGRECLFGDIVNGEMKLNEYGKIADECWKWLFQQYAYLNMDEFVIMPNHFHGIISLTDNDGSNSNSGSNVGAGFPRPSANTQTQGAVTAPLQPIALGKIVSYFKYETTKRINKIRNTPGHKLWQRNYHERVIRHENELNEIRQYVQDNPLKWDLDPENPSNVKS
jgi:REP element-mobilizing transposase RayT